MNEGTRHRIDLSGALTFRELTYQVDGDGVVVGLTGDGVVVVVVVVVAEFRSVCNERRGKPGLRISISCPRRGKTHSSRST